VKSTNLAPKTEEWERKRPRQPESEISVIHRPIAMIFGRSSQIPADTLTLKPHAISNLFRYRSPLSPVSKIGA
jgi:hypothetical protein